jgi:hypothetical protein
MGHVGWEFGSVLVFGDIHKLAGLFQALDEFELFCVQGGLLIGILVGHDLLPSGGEGQFCLFFGDPLHILT